MKSEGAAEAFKLEELVLGTTGQSTEPKDLVSTTDDKREFKEFTFWECKELEEKKALS